MLARPRCLQAVEDDRGRLRAGLLGDDRHADCARPTLRSCSRRRRAKGVAGGEHDAAAFGKQPVRQLADGRRLAGAVDADDQDHIGLDVGIDR